MKKMFWSTVGGFRVTGHVTAVGDIVVDIKDLEPFSKSGGNYIGFVSHSEVEILKNYFEVCQDRELRKNLCIGEFECQYSVGGNAYFILRDKVTNSAIRVFPLRLPGLIEAFEYAVKEMVEYQKLRS